jgi:hypothetical protein
MSDQKGRRVTIDMTPTAASEIDRLVDLTGAKTADLFRQAFHLLRLYVDALQDGKALMILDPDDRHSPPVKVELVFPNPVSTAHKSTSRG